MSLAASPAKLARGADPAPVRSLPSAPSGGARVEPARKVRTSQSPFDYAGIGGAVYATGLEEVVATVVPVQEFLTDGFYPYVTVVHRKVGEQEVMIGSNRQRRVVRLGVPERGEIRLVGRCPDGGDPIFEAGPGSRNPDGQPHSRVRELRPGTVEVYFENTMEEGKRNDRTEQHWYKDYKVVFTGGVTADPGTLFLLNRVEDPDPATRSAARQALLQMSPRLARLAGVR